MITPFTIERFPGLVTGEPIETAGAVDLLNVLPGRDGMIRSRPGLYDTLTLPNGAPWSASANLTFIFSGYAGAPAEVVCGVSGGPPGDTCVSSMSLTSTDPNECFSVASLGTASAAYLLLACDGVTMRQYDGVGFAPVAYTGQNPLARWVAVQPIENRVVIAGPSLGGGSRVYFSDPGDHTTFGVNNYVGLTPGDGETISAIVAWRDLVFVFKQTRIFVFYGNSTDSTGNPVFNYRVLEGVGAVAANYMSAIAAPDGVYFYHSLSSAGSTVAGLYRTDGTTVSRVTAPLDHAFYRNVKDDALRRPPFLTYPDLIYQTDASLSYVNETVWVPLRSQAGRNVTLVYDIATAQSFLLTWDTAPDSRVFAATGGAEGAYVVTGTTWVRHMDPTYSQDRQNPLATPTDYTSHYRTSYLDLGAPGLEKVVRETLVYGSGSPRVQLSTDFRALDTASVVTLGVAPAVAQGRRRVAAKGELISTVLSASSGQWSVGRITHHITSVSRRGLKGA